MNATSTQDRGHRRPDEDAERRLLDAAVRRVGDGVHLDLDRLGELARLLQVRALRQVPEDEVEVRVAGLGRGARGGAVRRVLAAGDFLGDLVRGLEREVVRLGALGRGRARRVGVDREKEVRLLVVRDRGPVVERQQQVGVARQDGAAGERLRQRRDDPLRDLERGVLLEEPARPDRSGFRAAVAGVDRRSSSCGPTGAGARVPPTPRAPGAGARSGARPRRRGGPARSADRRAPRGPARGSRSRRVSPANRTDGDERVVVLLLGKGRVDLRVGEADLEALLRERRRRLRRVREPQHDLRRRRDVDDGHLDRERRRTGGRERPRLLRGVPRARRRRRAGRGSSRRSPRARRARPRPAARAPKWRRCACRPGPAPCRDPAGSGGRRRRSSGRPSPGPTRPSGRARARRPRRRTPCPRACRRDAISPFQRSVARSSAGGRGGERREKDGEGRGERRRRLGCGGLSTEVGPV